MQNLNSISYRNDAVQKVTGTAKFTADIKLHGMLHAVPVYTDYVNAIINTINTTEAESSPGVVRVITYKDVPGENLFGQISKDCPMFVSNRIRCHGDVIALVVAKTREQAIDASKKISIDALELPAIFDPEEAMNNKILVHEESKTNIVNTHHIRKGNIEKGFEESQYIVEKKFTTQLNEHAYIETECAICDVRDDGVVEVRGSMQHPFSVRKFVAASLNMQLADVEVIETAIGGGFGGKDDTAVIVCARAAIASKLTKKPVKIVYDREWSIRESYKRHPFIMYYKMGLSKKGKILAVQCKIIADAGAYTSVTPFVTWRPTVQCCGPYVVPNVHCNSHGVFTNNPYTGAFRGFGSPQVNFAIEQLIEIAAEKVGLDSIELRKINIVKQNSETITGQILNNHTVSAEETLTKVLDTIEYKDKIMSCSHGESNSDELYGIGLAVSYRGVSLGAEGKDFCSAIVNVQFDGSVLLEVSVSENGQGLESAMIIILASELGIKKERIRYRRYSTSNIPDGGSTIASRGTIMGGGALINAIKKLKQKISAVVASELHCSESSVIFKDGFLSDQTEKFNITWEAAIHKMFMAKIFPYAFGEFRSKETTWDEKTGQGNAYFTWVYGCQAVELTVNKKTGKIKLLNIVAAHDIGKAINKSALLGQYYGGIAQGVGHTLFEKINTSNGEILTTNFNTFKIPRAHDIPNITGIIIENNDPESPTSAKSIGEPALELIAPAIANAVYNATGTRYYDLPIKVK